MAVCEMLFILPPKFTGKCAVWVRQWDAKAQLEATHTPWEAARAGQSFAGTCDFPVGTSSC